MAISIAQRAYNWALTAQIDRVLAGNVVGYAFCLTKNRRVVVERYYGYARAPWEQVDPAIPMSSDTRMFIASMSKPITAFSLAIFIEKWNAISEIISVFGRDLSKWPAPSRAMGVDLRFVDYVANHGGPIDISWHYTDLVRDFLTKPIGSGVGQVTLQNILEHKGGLGFGSATYDTSDASWASNFWAWASAELANPVVGQPGTYKYDNRNYVLLRGLIESPQNVMFPEFALSNILWPAGCVNISMINDDPAPARYYQQAESSTRPVHALLPSDGIDFGYDNSQVCGAYGWYASVRELTYFLNYVSQYLPAKETTNEIKQFIGWETVQLSYGTAYGHNGSWNIPLGGSVGGSNGAYFILPDGSCAALLINGTNEDAQELLLSALQNLQPYIEQPNSKVFLTPTVRNPIHYGQMVYTKDGSVPLPTSATCAPDAVFPGPVQNGLMSVFDGAVALTGPVRFSATPQAQRPADAVAHDSPGLQSLLINGPLTPDWHESVHAPDIPSSPIVGTSTMPDADVQAQNNRADFAYAWSGYLDAPLSGMYIIHASSDDGCLVWLDNTLILDEDGIHGPPTPPSDSLSIELQAGKHPIRIGYFQHWWGASLSLSWTRPDGVTEPIAAARYTHV